MKKLPVFTKGERVAWALVDDDDYATLARLRWYLMRQKGYVCQWSDSTLPRYLHRCILQPPPGLVTDHINGNRLDNQRANLRALRNADNIRLQLRARGYSWHPPSGFWYCCLTVRGFRFRQHFRHEHDARQYASELRILSLTLSLPALRRHAAKFHPSTGFAP